MRVLLISDKALRPSDKYVSSDGWGSLVAQFGPRAATCEETKCFLTALAKEKGFARYA